MLLIYQPNFVIFTKLKCQNTPVYCQFKFLKRTSLPIRGRWSRCPDERPPHQPTLKSLASKEETLFVTLLGISVDTYLSLFLSLTHKSQWSLHTIFKCVIPGLFLLFPSFQQLTVNVLVFIIKIADGEIRAFVFCGQSYKRFTRVNYNPIVVIWAIF